MEEGGDGNEEKEQNPRRIFERVCGGVGHARSLR